MQTIQTLANEVLKALTQATRDNGDRFFSLRDESPEWMQDLCQEAHGRMLPDDHKYQFIFEALDALSNHDNEDDARDSIEADIYNADLLSWVSSNLSRAAYVNDAVQNYGMSEQSFDLFGAIQMGQTEEKREVFETVLSQLQNRLDEVEAA